MNDEAPKSEASDTYEAKYMEGGAALARSKKRMPWWFFALLFTPLVAIPAATLASGAPFLATLPGLLLSVVMMSLAGLLLSHLRLVVTRTHLHVQLGLWGPKIALEQIESIKAGAYDWKRFGGWGIRRSLGGAWTYSIPGGSGQCVEVAWRDEKGRQRTHVVSSDNASEIVAAVEQARAARGLTGVRVVAEEAAAGATTHEVEASANVAPAERAKRG